MTQGMMDQTGMDRLEQEIAEASLVQHDHVAIDPKDDSGLQALALIAKHFDIAFDVTKSWYVHGKSDGLFSHIDIIRCAKRVGLKAKLVTINHRQLKTFPTPFIATHKSENHRYMVRAVTDSQIELFDPINCSNSDLI